MGETFLISLVGGYCFYLLKTPIPWTLGPLFATLLWQRVAKRNVSWSLSLRNLGLLVVGYSMGCFFTPESSELIFNQLPFMLIVTTLTIGVSIVTAYVTHRMIDNEPPSSTCQMLTTNALTQMTGLGYYAGRSDGFFPFHLILLQRVCLGLAYITGNGIS